MSEKKFDSREADLDPDLGWRRIQPGVRAYDPRYRASRKRPRPGRYVPQFLAMRIAHDKHRKLWPDSNPLTDFAHWTDCDTCLALEMYDRRIAITPLPLWKHALVLVVTIAAILAVTTIFVAILIRR